MDGPGWEEYDEDAEGEVACGTWGERFLAARRLARVEGPFAPIGGGGSPEVSSSNTVSSGRASTSMGPSLV